MAEQMKLPDELIELIITRAPVLALATSRCMKIAINSNLKTILPRNEWRITSLDSLRVMVHLGQADQLMMREWVELATASSGLIITIDELKDGLELLIGHGVYPTVYEIVLIVQLVDAQLRYFHSDPSTLHHLLCFVLGYLEDDETELLAKSLRPRSMCQTVHDWVESLTNVYFNRVEEPQVGTPEELGLMFCIESLVMTYSVDKLARLIEQNTTYPSCVLYSCSGIIVNDVGQPAPYAWEAINVSWWLLSHYNVDFSEYDGHDVYQLVRTLPVFCVDKLRTMLPTDMSNINTDDFHSWRPPDIDPKHNLSKILTRLIADPTVGQSSVVCQRIKHLLQGNPGMYNPRTIRRIGRTSILNVLEDWWHELHNSDLPVDGRGFWIRVRVMHDNLPLLQRLYRLAGTPSIPHRQQEQVYHIYQRSPECLIWMIRSKLITVVPSVVHTLPCYRYSFIVWMTMAPLVSVDCLLRGLAESSSTLIDWVIINELKQRDGAILINLADGTLAKRTLLIISRALNSISIINDA